MLNFHLKNEKMEFFLMQVEQLLHEAQRLHQVIGKFKNEIELYMKEKN